MPSDDRPRLQPLNPGSGGKVVLAGEPPAAHVSWSTVGRIGPAMIVIVLGLVATYAIPALGFARPWKPGDPVPFWNLLGRLLETDSAAQVQAQAHAAAVEEVTQQVLAADEPAPRRTEPEPVVVEAQAGDKLPPYVAQAGDDEDVVQSLELFDGTELDHFFASLARSEASLAGAVTRVVHWGDSAIGVDGIPSAIRRRMQNRFGDSGHGFHLITPPNSSYRHREVKFSAEGWQDCFIIRRCRSDGHYGLGGATARSNGGAETTIAPNPDRSSGKVSKLEVWYAAQPRGGRLRIRVDRGEKEIVQTDAEELEDRWHAIEVPDGMHELEVRAAGGGKVRVYGVTLERDRPGVVWDGLALVGAFTNRMLAFDPDHLKDQLDHREADLVVFTFGGNDMIRNVPMKTIAGEYREVVQMVRKARPQMDCLIMAPLDHGERKGVRIVSRSVVAPMVQAQREVAKSEGCAFFDTWSAMGGDGSAGRWFHHKPRLMSGDLGHASHKGHQVIGELFYRSLIEAYVAYRERMDRAGGIPVSDDS